MKFSSGHHNRDEYFGRLYSVATGPLEFGLGLGYGSPFRAHAYAHLHFRRRSLFVTLFSLLSSDEHDAALFTLFSVIFSPCSPRLSLPSFLPYLPLDTRISSAIQNFAVRTQSKLRCVLILLSLSGGS